MNMYNSVVMDVSDIWMAVVMSTAARTMEAVGEYHVTGLTNRPPRVS